MDKQELRKILNLHKKWLDGDGGVRANLCEADLSWSDLRGSDLRGSDLRGADVDCSSWLLCCGSIDVKIDKRIAAQLAYHFCRVVCDDQDVIDAQNALKKLANTFHRVDEYGRV